MSNDKGGTVESKHIVQFSTGIGSAEVARWVIGEHGVDHTILLTADTRAEDPDNWRFAKDVHTYLGAPEWVVLADGRTPMEVGRDHRCVPNNRMAVCSRILKRELLRTWINGMCDPAQDIIYLGYDWTEAHRHTDAVPHWQPYQVRSPLIDPPYGTKAALIEQWRRSYGIEPPRLYAQGFGHANCAGACVRGGQAQWELLLRVNRDTYLKWEGEEDATRTLLGKDVAILRDRTGGELRPLSLRRFRERLESQPALFDTDDWGACGCTDEVVGWEEPRHEPIRPQFEEREIEAEFAQPYDPLPLSDKPPRQVRRPPQSGRSAES